MQLEHVKNMYIYKFFKINFFWENWYACARSSASDEWFTTLLKQYSIYFI